RRRPRWRRRMQPEERSVMRAASRHYGTIAALVVAVVGVLGWGAWEANGRIHAGELVRAIEKAQPGELGKLVADDLPRYRRWADRQLRALAEGQAGDERQRLRARPARGGGGPPQGGPPSFALAGCPAEELPVLRDSLYPYRDQLADFLWKTLRDPTRRRDPQVRAPFNAGVALARYFPDSPEWAAADFVFLADRLLESSQDEQRALRS